MANKRHPGARKGNRIVATSIGRTNVCLVAVAETKALAGVTACGHVFITYSPDLTYSAWDKIVKRAHVDCLFCIANVKIF